MEFFQHQNAGKIQKIFGRFKHFHDMRSFAKIFVQSDSVKSMAAYRTGDFSEIRPDTGPDLMSGAPLILMKNIYRILDNYKSFLHNDHVSSEDINGFLAFFKIIPFDLLLSVFKQEKQHKVDVILFDQSNFPNSVDELNSQWATTENTKIKTKFSLSNY